MKKNTRIYNRKLIFSLYNDSKQPIEIFTILKKQIKTYPSLRTIYRWIDRFKNTQVVNFDDLERCGHPITKRTKKNVAHIESELKMNPKLTIYQIKNKINTNISIGSLHSIIHDCLLFEKKDAIWTKKLGSK